MTWFSSPAQAAERLTAAGYLADAATATTACVAGALENPLLLEVPTTSAVRRSYWLNPEPESSAGDSAARGLPRDRVDGGVPQPDSAPGVRARPGVS